MELLWLLAGGALFGAGVLFGARLSSGRLVGPPRYRMPAVSPRPAISPEDIVAASLGDPSILMPPPNGTVKTKPGFSKEEIAKAERQMSQGKGGFSA